MGNGNPNSGPADADCIWGLPILLWGSPGIGKSHRVKAAAKSVFLEAKTVFAATRAPEDFSGAPFVKGDKLVNECILGAVRELVDIGRGVLFLDEITCAVPSVQSALLGVVLDRTVGDTKLPGKVRVMAAANPPNEAAGGWELAPPLANRFAHINVSDPSASEWLNWFLQESIEELTEIELAEQQLIENWPVAWSRVKGLMAGFFRHLPDRLFRLPKSSDKNYGRAWPSPRMWEAAARAVATCYSTDTPRELIFEFVAACVGEPVAVEWSKWVHDADLPDPHEVVTKGWLPDKMRLDRTAAVFTSMTSYAIQEKNKDRQKEYALGAWKVLVKGMEVGILDLTIQPSHELVKAGLGSEAGAEIAAISRPIILIQGKSGIADLHRKKATP